MLRLDKYLSDMGVGTRTEVNKFIRAGDVLVNGDIIKNTGIKIDETKDEVFIFGKQILYRKYFYIMLNKPKGYVTATEDNYQKTVLDLIEDELIKKRVAPAGRLDIDTEGFVFLTDDGMLNHKITGPKGHVNKKYYVELAHDINKNDIDSLESGVILDDGYKTMPSKVVKISSRAIYLTIGEGKFHQVKRMLKSVENEVVYLKRISIGGLELDKNLKPGEYRQLSCEEIEDMLGEKWERG